ncbi:hypothetical protein J4425_02740 [Candidatus Woesearchaeota archaeon]|nr:hypothetical protein [Candidatus Woesearchaeota archaeon]
MNKKMIEKNTLDLEYKRELQINNSILLLGTASLLPLIISFIGYQERWGLGLALTFSIAIVSYSWYKKSDKKLKHILGKIKKL